MENELGVRPSQLCMIACHAWDTRNAVAAGWEAAFIGRPGTLILLFQCQPALLHRFLSNNPDLSR
jgi:2-haloacid dehalogenase